MFIRLTVSSLLTLALAQSVFAQQEPAPAYPPGTYQPQPAPFPQQPYPQQQMQPQQYPPGGYPSPLAADPNAPQYAQPPGGYPPGYVYGPPQQPMELPEQIVSSVEGALQLSLGTYFMRFTSASRDFDSEAVADQSLSDLVWGLSESSTVTIEGGYGITDRLLIGGILQLGGTSGTLEPDGLPEIESSSFDLLIGPKAEFHFLPTSKFNPYAGAAIALASHSDEPSSQLMFNFQIRGGVRCFITDSLSIDPGLVFAFGFGGGSFEDQGMDFDYGISGFRIGLTLNVSGWLR